MKILKQCKEKPGIVMCNLFFCSHAVAKRETREFTKDTAAKNDDKTIKAGQWTYQTAPNLVYEEHVGPLLHYNN